MAIYRVFEGKNWEPRIESGNFVLADPANGREQHKAENKVLVTDEHEAVRLIEKRGFYIWVESKNKNWTLVRKNLFHDGRAIT